MSLRGQRIVVGVTGSIAAYKSVVLVRELMRRGAEVRVVMTESATRFVGPITFTGVTGRPAVVDLWDPSYPGEVHVELGAWATAMVIAPATMHTLSRAACGLADDVVLATYACTDAPVVFVPSMHERMWRAPATQDNVERLVGFGAQFIGPVVGVLASGETGEGRMVEPVEIAQRLEAMLGESPAADETHERASSVTTLTSVASSTPGPAPTATKPLTQDDLLGMRVLITAGPTLEDLDPVRFLGNRSTGKMGYALAERAARRGANVTLVTGPVAITPPSGVEVVPVRSAVQMHEAVMARVFDQDIAIMAAAVADYRPAECADSKIKKSGPMTVKFVRNPDILCEVGEHREATPRILVGFALETDNLEARGRLKLENKRADLIVANLADNGFARDTNQALLIDRHGTAELGTLAKTELADRIFDHVLRLLVKTPRAVSDKARA